MGKLQFLLRCVKDMDYAELFRTVGKVHKLTGKNSAAILTDVIQCGLKYGAGFNDYLLCEFYNLTDAQRATYITRKVNNDLVRILNDRDYYHFFDNKTEFYTTFAKYIGRQWLDFSKASKEDFKAFMETRDAVMVKPESSSGGFGVNKLFKKDFSSLDAMYDQLKAQGIGVVEDVLQQHETMNKMNPHAINTLRVVTVLNETGPTSSMPISASATATGLWTTSTPAACSPPLTWKRASSSTLPTIRPATPIRSIPAPTPRSRALPSPIGRRPRPCAWRPLRWCPRCAMWARTWPSRPTALCSWRATTCPAMTSCKCRPTPRIRSACCPASGNL